MNLQEKRSFYATTDLDLATMLITFGVPLVKERPTLTIKPERGIQAITQFNFEGASADGKYQAQDLAEYWTNDNFAEANGEHALTYMKYAFMNRKRLIDHCKAAKPLTSIKRRRGGREVAYLVREGSDEHTEILNRDGR